MHYVMHYVMQLPHCSNALCDALCDADQAANAQELQLRQAAHDAHERAREVRLAEERAEGAARREESGRAKDAKIKRAQDGHLTYLHLTYVLPTLQDGHLTYLHRTNVLPTLQDGHLTYLHLTCVPTYYLRTCVALLTDAQPAHCRLLTY